jgi:hypothetical protein
VLDRLAAAVTLVDVHVADAERTEQPLVANGDQEVRAQPSDVERQRARRLRHVEDDRGTQLVRALAHGLELDQGAVRPVHVRHRDDAHPLVERLEDRLGP